MSVPTIEQRAIAAADHARRYATVQNLPVESHTDALRAVIHASERTAHLSQGYRPDEESTLTYPRLFVMAMAGLGLWAAVGYVLAPAVARFLTFLGVFA